MAHLYKPNNDIVEVQPKNGTDFQAEELHAFVDGTFEIVFLGEEEGLLICNKNYLAEGLELNFMASLVGERYGVWMGGGYFCGNVLLCKSNEVL